MRGGCPHSSGPGSGNSFSTNGLIVTVSTSKPSGSVKVAPRTGSTGSADRTSGAHPSTVTREVLSASVMTVGGAK